MKIKNYIPVILCSIALCSCSDADKNIAFGLDSDAIKAEAAGGSHKIKVSASGDWVATTDEPWISISPANGRGTTECRILIDSALTDSPRRGVVRIQEQNTWDKKEITIDQQSFDYAITLGEKEVSVANFSSRRAPPNPSRRTPAAATRSPCWPSHARSEPTVRGRTANAWTTGTTSPFGRRAWRVTRPRRTAA